MDHHKRRSVVGCVCSNIFAPNQFADDAQRMLLFRSGEYMQPTHWVIDYPPRLRASVAFRFGAPAFALRGSPANSLASPQICSKKAFSENAYPRFFSSLINGGFFRAAFSRNKSAAAA